MIRIQRTIEPAEIFTNITEDIQLIVDEYHIKEGLILIYSKHTTACIGLLEDETLLKIDEKDFFERLASSNCLYRHDDIEKRDVPPDERRNGYSHLRAMLLNNQVIIPIINSKLDIGKWQKLFYIECDLGKEDRTYNIIIIENV
jgi:secondary thiamine-phosphate synthase enzyme